MTAQSTSILAYQDLQPKLGKLQKVVYDFLRTHGSSCNSDIKDGTHLEINVVTPRVKELRELGLVKQDYTARHPKTKKRVIYWGIAKVQVDAFKFFQTITTRQPTLWGNI